MILNKILQELILIRKELQAIRGCAESNSEYVTVLKANYLKNRECALHLNGETVTKKPPTFREVSQASRRYLQE